MKAHCIMHVPFEGPGYVKDWFYSHGVPLRYWKLYENTELPEPSDVDFLLVMGGPMNIYEYDKYSFLKKEKQLIRECINSHIKVLGICLGAQLIADVLGEKTYPNPDKEIGWFPVAGDREVLPGSFIPFHWHGETFDLPREARHLASSLACRNQAFSYKDHVLALQFHLEVNPELVGGLLEHASADLTEGDWVQEPGEIVGGLKHAEVNREALFSLLEQFTGIKS